MKIKELIKIKTYKFYTKTNAEGIVEHNIEAESCKKAYEILLISGYNSKEIYNDWIQIGV